jgi:hypothetical protein
VLAIAEALREEIGVTTDAHTGGEGTEAGWVDRAFRATARGIVASFAEGGDDPASVRTYVIRLAALQRLSGLGVGLKYAEVLICSELKLAESWLACLALSPVSIIDRERPDRVREPQPQVHHLTGTGLARPASSSMPITITAARRHPAPPPTGVVSESLRGPSPPTSDAPAA